jgi:hypothetical protein
VEHDFPDGLLHIRIEGRDRVRLGRQFHGNSILSGLKGLTKTMQQLVHLGGGPLIHESSNLSSGNGITVRDEVKVESRAVGLIPKCKLRTERFFGNFIDTEESTHAAFE